jgi:hypothetical protein
MRPAGKLCLPGARVGLPAKKVKGKRSQFPFLSLFLILALTLAVIDVSPVSAEVKIALASPHDLDNLCLGAGQTGSFKLRVYNRPESESSLRFEITAAGGIAPFLSFSDNGFVLAPDTSEQVVVTISPITQENVYEGEISVYACSLGGDEGGSPVVASVGTRVRLTVTKMPAPPRPMTSVILIVVVACAVVVGTVWVVRRRGRSMPASNKGKQSSTIRPLQRGL